MRDSFLTTWTWRLLSGLDSSYRIYLLTSYCKCLVCKLVPFVILASGELAITVAAAFLTTLELVFVLSPGVRGLKNLAYYLVDSGVPDK